MLDTESRWFRPFAHVFTVINAAEADQVSIRDIASLPMEGDDWPVKEGLGRLVSRLGADLPVSLNTVAEEIDWSGRDGVVVRTSKGDIAARAVLITVSIGILQSGLIRFRPALPGGHDRRHRRLLSRCRQPHRAGFRPRRVRRCAAQFHNRRRRDRTARGLPAAVRLQLHHRADRRQFRRPFDPRRPEVLPPIT